VAEALLRRGDDVSIVDNFNSFYDPQLKRKNIKEIEATGAIRLIEGDLLDAQVRRDALADCDAVIHLAAWAGVRPSIEMPVRYVEQNLLMPTLLVQSMRDAHIKSLVWASSSSVYGENANPPFAEDADISAPVSPYAATKVGGEALAASFAHLYDLDITSLRFFTVYGPRQRPEMAIHKFARLLKQGRAIPRFGDGTTSRDYTYIDDIVIGVLGALDHLGGCRVYNLGESDRISLQELIDLLAQTLGVEARIDALPRQAGDVSHTNADIRRAQRDINYQPQVPIHEGIQRFCTWFNERPDLWQAE
jgi:UDP-glucuronate 4-epimerase